MAMISEYIYDEWCGSTDDNYDSDEINSDIEAELYSSIHHDLSHLSQLDTDDSEEVANAIASNETHSKSEEIMNFNFAIKNNNFNSLCNNLSNYSEAETDIEIVEVTKESLELHKGSSKINFNKNNVNCKSSVINIDSSDSEDSIIYIDPKTVRNLQTNVNMDSISFSSDLTNDEEEDLFSEMHNTSGMSDKNAKDPWHINKEDFYHAKKNVRRYHRASMNNAPRKCFICGDEHFGSICENRACCKCFTVGHDFKSCQIPITKACPICKMKGHVPQDCPDLWRRYHHTTVSKQVISKSLSKRNQTEIYCYNCGAQGHFGGVCTLNIKNNYSYTTWPMVVTYENPYKTLKKLQKKGAKFFIKRNETKSYSNNSSNNFYPTEANFELKKITNMIRKNIAKKKNKKSWTKKRISETSQMNSMSNCQKPRMKKRISETSQMNSTSSCQKPSFSRSKMPIWKKIFKEKQKTKRAALC